ncbi:CocE/NonD family hydrolase [Streptomyces sp. TP-A0356]|uniref:CocE/NonD family hydrolase n=1 Tax=Streptomyces sp. TP-A0356 TaxID=1359208 RepID=UPI0006E1EA23|nr:CocE/NonD family hydrolase [Streptomyces sp. TP-A0356]
MSTAVPVPFGTPVPQAEPFRVPMRDGVRLHTEVHLPPSPTRLPAVLIRTPYDKTHPDTLLPDMAARLTEAGLAVVTQDVRGKIRSEGVPAPFVTEVPDAWDALEWITAQPWSDGTVGCWGNSYYGYTAWAAVACGHPAVRALVSRLTTTDIGGELVHRNGVFRLGPMVEWLTSTWADRANLVPRLDWSRRPLAELLDAVTARPGAVPLSEWATASPADRRWRQTAFDGRAPGHGRVPTLHWTGWYDPFQSGQLRDWRRARQAAGAPQYLIATATDHQDDVLTANGRSPDHLTDPAAREAMLDRSLGPVIDFLLRHLGRREGGDPVPSVRWESIGGDRRAATRWPPPGAVSVRLHLTDAPAAAASPEGGAPSQRADGRPASASWEHDPENLVPATDRNWWRPLLALPDERSTERRPDVLTFTGAASCHPLQLGGPVRLVLPVTSTAAVGHLVVKLCDVAPGGTSRRILEAPYRMHGDSEAWHRAHIELGDTGHRLEPGHRLRVQVASSCFPLYLPHTAGTTHPWSARRLIGSTQRLLTGGQDGAYLELTALPDTHTPPSAETDGVGHQGKDR